MRPTAARSPTTPLLFRAEDVILKRGERVGLIGANGAGKTTFVKTLLGQIPPLAGELRVGASVRIGYLAQVQAALEAGVDGAGDVDGCRPRRCCRQKRGTSSPASCSATKMCSKPWHTLSGGQRSRLALARLSRQHANFLVLDEPTNHLDIESQEVLEEMLADFNGTVLLVSHDRYLIDAIATQVWAIDDGGYGPTRRLQRLCGRPTGSAGAGPKSPKRRATEAQEYRRRSQEERRQRREEEKQAAEVVGRSAHPRLERNLAEIAEALEAPAAQRLDRGATPGRTLRSGGTATAII